MAERKRQGGVRERRPRACIAIARTPAGRCAQGDVGATVRLSGWVHRVRDHGGLLFIDLRDHYGLTQVVADPDSPAFKAAETVRSEWVIRVDGEVRDAARRARVNPELPTGEIEVFASEIEVLSAAKELPMPVFGEPDYPEDLRLQVPLPRPAPRDAAPQHHAAQRDHRLDPRGACATAASSSSRRRS